MEQQRRLLLFITLSFAILILWTNLVLPKIAPKPPAVPPLLSDEEAMAAFERPVSALSPFNVLPEIKAPPKPAGMPDHPPQTVMLGSLDPASRFFIQVELTSRGAAVQGIDLNDPRYPELGHRNRPLRVVGHDALSEEKTLATLFPKVDAQLGKETLETIHWEVVRGSQTETSVQFRIVSPDGALELTKTYEIQKLPEGKQPDKETRDNWADGYFVKLTVAARNLSPDSVEVQYDLRGPVSLPLEDPDNAYKHRDIRLGFLNAGGSVDSSTYAAKKAVDQKNAKNVDVWKRQLQYIGVDTQYFAALVHPVDDQIKSRTVAESHAEVIKEGPKPQHADLSVTLTSEPRKLGPRDDESAAFSDQYVLYAGPKRQPLLASLKADSVLDYGMFGWLVVLMLAILNGLHSIGLNYGIAIIGLTCLVRAAIFPLSRYQSHSMDKMKELQPKIKVLHEKYKKNPESLTREEMRTMSEVQFKMMWGCLPMLAQMPIFIALYQSLRISVDLRMAPLHLVGHWIDNLASPDSMFPFGFALPFLGWTEFNLLPLLTIVLFTLNQKLTMPPPADEEQELQYKMMNVMMAVMGVFFYRVPSGLCVYFITSSIWGMTERMLLKRSSQAKSNDSNGTSGTPVPAPEPPKPSGEAPKGKPSLLDEWKSNLRKLQEMADKPSAASRESEKPNRKRKGR